MQFSNCVLYLNKKFDKLGLSISIYRPKYGQFEFSDFGTCSSSEKGHDAHILLIFFKKKNV